MTHLNDFTLPVEIVEQITENGIDCLSELNRTIINIAMQIEWERYLKASFYKRNENRPTGLIHSLP